MTEKIFLGAGLAVVVLGLGCASKTEKAVDQFLEETRDRLERDCPKVKAASGGVSFGVGWLSELFADADDAEDAAAISNRIARAARLGCDFVEELVAEEE